MAIKKYILIVEFDDNGDNCEYIEEKLVSEVSEKNTIVGELELEDYFSKSDISCLVNSKTAKA